MSANRLAELGLLLPCAGRFGMRGGQGLQGIIGSCAGIVLRAVSKSVEGKITTAGGRGECRRRDSSSVSTVARTSVKSESRRERSRLASAGTAWLPTKARAFDPDERILSKLACAEGWRASRNPKMVDSHQSSQDMVSLMPTRANSRPVSTAYGR